MSDMVERVARIIDPSSWRVMDSEKASMLRKYKGKNVGWPSDQFQHKESMAKAQEIIAAIQADAAPVAWMYERGSERKAYVERSQAALACGYAETPLYAHPPVDNRVSTSSPVDDRAAPETSVNLRDAVEVWEDAFEAYNFGEQAAAAVIEADREAVRAYWYRQGKDDGWQCREEQAAEIARLKTAWEAQHREKVKERKEAKLWFEQAQEAAAELAKYKALAEMLVGKIELFLSMLIDNDSDFGEVVEEFLSAVEPALRQYKESHDAVY